MFPTNFTYVQPNSAASEGSSDLDHRDEMDTESHTYDGVRKYIYSIPFLSLH